MNAFDEFVIPAVSSPLYEMRSSSQLSAAPLVQLHVHRGRSLRAHTSRILSQMAAAKAKAARPIKSDPLNYVMSYAADHCTEENYAFIAAALRAAYQLQEPTAI